MDGTLDAWDILHEQREAVLDVKVMCTFKRGKRISNLLFRIRQRELQTNWRTNDPCRQKGK
jgi:hypothetical protein